MDPKVSRQSLGGGGKLKYPTYGVATKASIIPKGISSRQQVFSPFSRPGRLTDIRK